MLKSTGGALHTLNSTKTRFITFLYVQYEELQTTFGRLQSVSLLTTGPKVPPLAQVRRGYRPGAATEERAREAAAEQPGRGAHDAPGDAAWRARGRGVPMRRSEMSADYQNIHEVPGTIPEEH